MGRGQFVCLKALGGWAGFMWEGEGLYVFILVGGCG